MTQERMGEARVQDIRPAVEEDQVVRVTRKPGAEQVASGLEAEAGDTQGSSSGDSEGEVVGGNEIARGEGFVKGEGVGVAAVGLDNLIDREDIRRASDKTVVEVHDEQAPSEGFPEGGGCEETDCMKVGRGGHVEVEAEAGKSDARLGRHSGSSHADPEAKKEDHGEANEDLCRRITSREKLTCGECVGGVLIDVEPERGRLWD